MCVCVCVCVCVFFRKTGMSKPETGSAAYIKSNHLIDFVLQFCYTVRYQYVSVRFRFRFSHLADAFIQSDLQLGST